MKIQILNSAAQKLAPSEAWPVEIAPFGDFQGVMIGPGDKKKPFTQHLNREAFERVIAAWQAKGSPELLVDADHQSCDEDGSTRALAWASNLRIVDERGLYADFKFTAEGAEAVNDRIWRFVSPVFDLNEQGEIIALDSIALTNRPNLPVSCVLNRGAGFENVEDNEGNTTMEKILSALGLASDASEDDALAAIEALKKESSDAQAALLKNEAEACAEENKDKIANRGAFVELYVKNGRDTALQFLAAVRAPSPSVKRVSVENAATPAATVGVGDASAKTAARNRAVNEYLAAHPRATHTEAWSACRQADPDTFTD